MASCNQECRDNGKNIHFFLSGTKMRFFSPQVSYSVILRKLKDQEGDRGAILEKVYLMEEIRVDFKILELRTPVEIFLSVSHGNKIKIILNSPSQKYLF